MAKDCAVVDTKLVIMYHAMADSSQQSFLSNLHKRADYAVCINIPQPLLFNYGSLCGVMMSLNKPYIEPYLTYSFRLQGVVGIVSLRHGWNICSLEFATQFRIENCKSSFTWALIFLHVVRDWVCAHVQGVCCHAGKSYSNFLRRTIKCCFAEKKLSPVLV